MKESNMINKATDLGGRLPLVSVQDLSARQKEVYNFVESQFVPWADAAGFEAQSVDGRLIGPFNSALVSPELGSAFLAWQVAEEKHTSLDARIRQVVILAVGAIWKSDYELYAHSAVARKAGLSETLIAQLCSGAEAAEMSDAERIAQRVATELTLSRRIKDDLFGEAQQALGLKGLVDLVQLVGAYQTVCGILNCFAIPAPTTTTSHASERPIQY
jgi:4-carboxymuconolactone decarboxylase